MNAERRSSSASGKGLSVAILTAASRSAGSSGHLLKPFSNFHSTLSSKALISGRRPPP